MKTVNFLKSSANKCKRKIVIAEINILRNLGENQMRQERIVREIEKLHSLWFKGTAKDLRIAELQDNWKREQSNLTQAFL